MAKCSPKPTSPSSELVRIVREEREDERDDEDIRLRQLRSRSATSDSSVELSVMWSAADRSVQGQALDRSRAGCETAGPTTATCRWGRPCAAHGTDRSAATDTHGANTSAAGALGADTFRADTFRADTFRADTTGRPAAARRPCTSPTTCSYAAGPPSAGTSRYTSFDAGLDGSAASGPRDTCAAHAAHAAHGATTPSADRPVVSAANQLDR